MKEKTRASPADCRSLPASSCSDCMARVAAGPEIERLIQLLARLPGLGPRSARRAALHLVKKKEQLLEPLATALAETRDTILTCEICGNIDTQSPCTLCRDPGRDRSLICVVEEVGDLWALERAGVLNGLYHVLGGTLSPLDGVGPDDLSIAKLIERAGDPGVKEVLLALNRAVSFSKAGRAPAAPGSRYSCRREFVATSRSSSNGRAGPAMSYGGV